MAHEISAEVHRPCKTVQDLSGGGMRGKTAVDAPDASAHHERVHLVKETFWEIALCLRCFFCYSRSGAFFSSDCVRACTRVHIDSLATSRNRESHTHTHHTYHAHAADDVRGDRHKT